MSERYKINNPAGIYFVTPTIVDWIDLFTRKEYALMIIDALKYCQENKGLNVHAFCIMHSHLHLIISSQDGYSLSAILRDFKKFTSKQIIKLIKEIPESRSEWLLERFELAGKKLNRITKYKVWQDGNQPKELITNKFTDEKLDYLYDTRCKRAPAVG